MNFTIRFISTSRSHRNIHLWRSFIEIWNGKNVFLDKTETSSDDMHFFIDAWFCKQWEEVQLSYCMTSKELYPTAVAVSLWRPLWSGKRIMVHCDNEGAVKALNKSYSNKPTVADIIRHVTFVCMKYNFILNAIHISGKRNIKADMLSRFQVKKVLANYTRSKSKTRKCGSVSYRNLQNLVVSYTTGGHASSTQSTCKQGTVTYHHFCGFIGLESRKGRVVPPSHKNLLLFIVYLAHFRKLSYSCIRTYVSAVRDWALQLGFKDPTNPAVSHHRHKYQKLLRGIQRASCCRKRIRKPLKRKQLCKILSMLEIQDSVDSRCIKAALTLAFYGFFRCSDYTLNAYNRKSFLRRKDIRIKLGSKPQLKVNCEKPRLTSSLTAKCP